MLIGDNDTSQGLGPQEVVKGGNFRHQMEVAFWPPLSHPGDRTPFISRVFHGMEISFHPSLLKPSCVVERKELEAPRRQRGLEGLADQ